MSNGKAAGLFGVVNEAGQERLEVEWVVPRVDRFAPAVGGSELNTKVVTTADGRHYALFMDEHGLHSDLWVIDETGACRANALAGYSVSDIASDGERLYVRSGSDILLIADDMIEARARISTTLADGNEIVMVGSSGLYLRSSATLWFWGQGEEPRILVEDLPSSGGIVPVPGGVALLSSEGLLIARPTKVERLPTGPGRCLGAAGDLVVVVAEEDIVVAKADGGGPTRVAIAARCGVRQSERRVVLQDADGAIWVSEDGGEFRRLVHDTGSQMLLESVVVATSGVWALSTDGEIHRWRPDLTWLGRTPLAGRPLSPPFLVEADDKIVTAVTNGPTEVASMDTVSLELATRPIVDGTYGVRPFEIFSLGEGAVFTGYDDDGRRDPRVLFRVDPSATTIEELERNVHRIAPGSDGNQLWVVLGEDSWRLKHMGSGATVEYESGAAVDPFARILPSIGDGVAVVANGRLWAPSSSVSGSMETIFGSDRSVVRSATTVAGQNGYVVTASGVGGGTYFVGEGGPQRLFDQPMMVLGKLDDDAVLAMACDEQAVYRIDRSLERLYDTGLDCSRTRGLGTIGDRVIVADDTTRELRLVALTRKDQLEFARFPPSIDNFPSVVLRDQLIFAADDGVSGREVWVTDGTIAGTRLLADIRPGGLGSDIRAFDVLGDHAVFWATNGTVRAVFATDTRRLSIVSSPSPEIQGSGAELPLDPQFALTRDAVVFRASSPRAGIEMHAFPRARLTCNGCCSDSDCGGSGTDSICNSGTCVAPVSRPEPGSLPLAEGACGCRAVSAARTSPGGRVLLTMLVFVVVGRVARRRRAQTFAVMNSGGDRSESIVVVVPIEEP